MVVILNRKGDFVTDSGVFKNLVSGDAVLFQEFDGAGSLVAGDYMAVVDADQMKLIQTNVYNYFGINEDILQNKAFGDQWSAFYEGCVEVFALQFSEAMTQALFSDREQSEGALLMATANRLQYLSSADKLNVSAQMADRGIMSINEIRDIWNLPPVEGGDVRMIRGEYYDTDEKTNNKEASASNDD